MDDKENNKIWKAYQKAQETRQLFDFYKPSSQLPLTYEDSLSPVPDYPISAVGILTVSGKWGNKQGIAFVVEDNYLLTCASNVFSHEHGDYPNITFTINSNRKHGYDTYKISKVFIPQEYKRMSQNERKQYNYALLYIEGKIDMIDRYGNIRIKINQKILATSLEQVIIKHGRLQLGRWEPFSQDMSMLLSGGPLSSENQAIGLIFWESTSSRPCLLRFDQYFNYNLGQWAHGPLGKFIMQGLQSFETDVSCLKNMDPKPIDRVDLTKCNLNGISFSFFEKLPFSDIYKLKLGQYYSVQMNQSDKIKDDLIFLKLDKFKNLKQLQLCRHGIGLIGCQILASLPLSNLRHLDLSGNEFGDQGCRHISKAQWPLLRSMHLVCCKISNEGVRHLLQQRRKNLCEINLQWNQLTNDVAKVFQNADIPRFDHLIMDCGIINSLGLQFLKSPSWTTLTRLKLCGSRFDNKGCRMLKQIGLVLRQIQLSFCNIDSIGVKWLCKANLTKMNILDLTNNYIREQGCFAMIRANMPNLTDIKLKDNSFGVKGMKCLLQAGWAQQVNECQDKFSSFYYLIYSFERSEFYSWLQL